MAITTSVAISVGAATGTHSILPGSLKYRVKNVIFRADNEPCVVVAKRIEGSFEVALETASAIASTASGGTLSTVTISGFDVVYHCVINVGYYGQGVQKALISFSGTKNT